MSDNDKPANSNVNLEQDSENEINNQLDRTRPIPSTSANSLKGKSEHYNLLKPNSIRFSKNVQLSNRNEDVNSIIENVLQQCEHSSQDEEEGNDNVNVNVIHPKQFNSLTSSEDGFVEPSNRSDYSLQGSSSKKSQRVMSSAAFRNFLLKNFPSNVSPQGSTSINWRDLSPLRNALLRPTNDTGIQVAVPSTPEQDLSDHLFSREAIERTSQQIQISPSLVPPRPILGDPPLQGAPPSYSAVMRIGTIINPRRLFGRRIEPHNIEPSPPFISPSPPPTYAEAQGHYFRPVVVESVDFIWGPDSMPAACPRCGIYVITTTSNQRSNLTHFAALALCLCGCWPCCLLPYCMNSCKNTYHYCPNCNTYLGMYRPW